MKFLLSIVIAAIFFTSCTKDDSNPISPSDVTGLDIALKLKEWSNHQPQKFVVCVFGDTTNGKLYDVGDLVTNLEFNPNTFNWRFTDSLHIEKTNAAGMDYNFSATKRKNVYDSISISLTESQMLIIISGIGFKFRMMYFDSLTNNLNKKLIEWANHQFPPKIIWAGFHTFVYEGPNFGGYSPVVYTYRGVQNLQYFTRNVNQMELQNIIQQVDTSLSFSELYNIMLPIAEIKIHDTSFFDE